MSQLIRALVATAALTLFSSGTQAADADAGAVLANTCLGCHGVPYYVNTYPTYRVPLIAGQHEAYLVDALKAYRAEARPHVTMRANAGSFTDENIADLAAYFASQRDSDFAPAAQPDKRGDAAAGADKAVTCASCHGADGNSAAPTFPSIAGQYEDYLIHSIKAYRDGDRVNAVMAPMVMNLSDQDIKDLAAYFAAQTGPLKTAE